MNRRRFLQRLGGLGFGFPLLNPLPSFAQSTFTSAILRALRENAVTVYFKQQFGLDLDHIYWGDLHCHSNYSSDANEKNCGMRVNSPAEALSYARNITALDFVAITDHAEMRSGSDVTGVLDNWQEYQKTILAYNDEQDFIIFPGWEYTNTFGLQPALGSEEGYGHKHVLFRELDNLPEKMIGAFGSRGSNEITIAREARDLWEALSDYLPAEEESPASAVTILHTPAVQGMDKNTQNHQTDFNFMNSIFVRSYEIYSKWGNFEGDSPPGSACEGETLIDHVPDILVPEKTVRTLLYGRWVIEGNPDFFLGFTGGTDDHAGQPGNSVLDQCGFPCRGGITGIASPVFSREGLWEALYNRHSLAATSDSRKGRLLAVETHDQHLLMGDVGEHNGTVRVRVLGSRDVDRLEILVDGCVRQIVFQATVDEHFNLQAGNHYVYARAITETAGTPRVTWSSPVYLREKV